MSNGKRTQSKEQILAHAVASGYVVIDGKLEHRTVWEKHYGRLPRGWVVHHINFSKTSNSIENLVALPDSVHNRLHRQMYKEKRIMSWDELWPIYLSELNKYKVEQEIKKSRKKTENKAKRTRKKNGKRARKEWAMKQHTEAFIDGMLGAQKKRKMARMIDKMADSNKAFEERKKAGAVSKT